MANSYFGNLQDAVTSIFEGLAVTASHLIRKPYTVQYPDRVPVRIQDTLPFRYRDKGSLATIGRAAAVADLPYIHLSGFPAWFAWLAIHIFFLIGFRNRILVILQWAWAYVTYQRGARLITGRDWHTP